MYGSILTQEFKFSGAITAVMVEMAQKHLLRRGSIILADYEGEVCYTDCVTIHATDAYEIALRILRRYRQGAFPAAEVRTALAYAESAYDEMCANDMSWPQFEFFNGFGLVEEYSVSGATFAWFMHDLRMALALLDWYAIDGKRQSKSECFA